MSAPASTPAFLAPFTPLPTAATRRRFLALDLGGGAPTSVRDFAMETQEQCLWCWAAVAVSVARKYAANTTWTQCSVATAFYQRQGEALQCCGADRAAGNRSQGLSAVFEVTRNLSGAAIATAIAFQDLAAQIQSDRPVCVRIGWRFDQHQSGHFIAVTGYTIGSGGQRYVHIQDPSVAAGQASHNQKDMTFEELTTGYDNGAGDWTWTYKTKP
ncbi:MAG: papain-like cysteine protease family protein [Phenylobacterium sp.]